MRRGDVSLLRVMAMLMVVAFHCIFPYAHNYAFCEHHFQKIGFYQHLTLFLSSIDLPMFVFISGYLFAYLKLKNGKYQDWKSFLKKKSKRLLIPFLIWSVVIRFLFFDKVQWNHFEVFHLWFLLMLMWCFVFIYLVRKLWERCPLWINLIFCMILFSSYYVVDSLEIPAKFLCLDSFLIYVPFFYFGTIWSRFSLDKRIFDLVGRKIFVLTLSICALIWFIIGLNASIHSDSLDGIFKICGFLFSISLFQSIIYCKEFVFSQWITSMDKSGMGIYILHQIFILLLLNLPWMESIMTQHVVLGPILLFIAVLLSSWLITSMVNKTRFSFLYG